MENIYHKIYDFCKIRNKGGVYTNSINGPTPRVKFLIELLEKEGIEYILDDFDINSFKSTKGYNIILPGSHKIGVTAHHDIVNPMSDNANDNSASVINAIALKKINPEITVCLLDGEEVGGLGSQRFSDLINNGIYNIDSILNFELTGRGGENFFIGNYPGKLYESLKEKFNPPTYQTIFNDSVIFRKNNIDSCVINPLPLLNEGKSSIKVDAGYLDVSILYLCHSMKDSVDKISVSDMEKFVYKISKLF